MPACSNIGSYLHPFCNFTLVNRSIPERISITNCFNYIIFLNL